MDTQDSLTADVPNFKLAKVGKERDRKRAGGGWWGARGAASGFSGAVGGAEAGAGGFMGTGMSLGKVLAILLLSGGVSAGAWQVGNMIAGNSAAGAKAAPKLFADKGGPYADTSGVIKEDKSIPNSLGYVNNDGLTDEQRAAKKAAEDAAARKAAEDAKKLAEEDAKKKALADAQAAAAASKSDAAPRGVFKKGLAAGKFGGMNSFGGGGSVLSGGAGLSGGINRNFSAAPAKAQAGNLAAFTSASKIASSKTSGVPRAAAGKGAVGQLFGANAGSHAGSGAANSGQTETASVAAGTPFDNGAGQGTAITGPGLGSGGTQPGPVGSGPTNPTTGGGGGGGGPIQNCPNANYQPDANGNCVNQTASPTGQADAPYQGLINAVLILMGLVMLLSILAMMVKPYAHVICMMVAALGAMIAGIGLKIMTMMGGDFKIGGIIAAVGGFIAVQAIMTMGRATAVSSPALVTQAAGSSLEQALAAINSIPPASLIA